MQGWAPYFVLSSFPGPLSCWPSPHSLTGSMLSRDIIDAGVGTKFWAALLPWSTVLLAWSTLTHRLKTIKVYHICRGGHNNGSDGLLCPSTFSARTKPSHWLQTNKLYHICRGGHHNFLRGLPSTIRLDQIHTLAPGHQGFKVYHICRGGHHSFPHRLSFPDPSSAWTQLTHRLNAI
jgi:hypothetical protein